MKTSRELLTELIAFPTLSRDSNLDLIAFIADYLTDLGISSRLIHNDEGTKANLFASIGPSDRAGIMLSGHTDVVPVEDQAWTSDPFQISMRDGRLYGRGSADMKGFIACVLAMAQHACQRDLHTPLHLAFSYDEEVGCIGVRRLLDLLSEQALAVRCCIVGEPTMMQVVVGHKGKTALRLHCYGQECHSSLAPHGMNAIHMASDVIQALRQLQQQIAAQGPFDEDYDVAYSTVHVGVINGGTAVNIVPNYCTLDCEIRHLADDPIEPHLVMLREQVSRIEYEAQQHYVDARIVIETLSSYPALNTAADAEVVAYVKSLTGGNSHSKVSFGTEGGLFQQRLQIPTVVCGPGSISQAHKPDEFVSETQLQACERFLAALLQSLC